MILNQLLHSPMVNTRLLIALSSLTWAALLFYPGDLFTESRRTYTLMAVLMPELMWATLFLIHGVAALLTLRFDLRSHDTLLCDAFLGCFLWTASTGACFAAHWNGSFATYVPPAAMSGEIWIMVFSWWYLLRHWSELPLKKDGN